MKTWLRLVGCRAYSKAAMVIGLSAGFALVSPHAWSATNSAPSPDPCLASPQPSYCKSEPPSAAPSTIVVGPKEKIHSIQAALDNIKSGRRSTIIVKPKSRPGEAYKEALKISKSVTIKADPEGQVTIQAPDGQCITIEPTSGYKAVSLVGLVIEQSCIITADADLALDDILMTTKSNSAIDVRSGHLFLGTDGSKLLPSSEKTASHPTSVRMTGAGTDGSAGSNDGIVSAYNSPVTIHYADLSGFHTALKVRAGADLQDSYIDHNVIGVEIEGALSNADVFNIVHPKITIANTNFEDNSTGIKADDQFLGTLIISGKTKISHSPAAAQGSEIEGISIGVPYSRPGHEGPEIAIGDAEINGMDTGIESKTPLTIEGTKLANNKVGLILRVRADHELDDYVLSGAKFENNDVGLKFAAESQSTLPIPSRLTIRNHTAWTSAEQQEDTQIVAGSVRIAECKVEANDSEICALSRQSRKALKAACHPKLSCSPF